MQSFRILSLDGINGALETIGRRWGAQADERDAFRAWAWVVAAVCETYAEENPDACAQLLSDEQAALHRVIAERLHRRGDIAGELVSKRAFLEFLAQTLTVGRARAA